jgi:hypothetical protein
LCLEFLIEEGDRNTVLSQGRPYVALPRFKAAEELNTMRFFAPFRRLLPHALIAMLISSGVSMASAQHLFGRRVGPGPRMAQVAARPGPGPGPRRNQEHLAQWMQQHSNLSPADQQRALTAEPGFRELPPDTQQRMRDRLTQLNNMSPERRRRLLERTEAMERLTLPERQQVRSAMQGLGELPQDRRRLVARAFRDLREMPPPQREAVLNSERFRGQFSPQEQSTLFNLLAVEPYLPIERPNDAPVDGK